ncbi:ATP-binding cassette domain-containing protein [Peptoniphilus harei]|uniref:ATP-binding cassette domain-containing protein n=1 Tax=Peptoniphilus harei TaxID=54005 RepID=A0A943SP20_9FIRM|nr:ATP-binding cassette domain-containing protein [Peptoniphilus harei]MBS6535613.1 ATP-binding cassette domain-containing protein [Peptoniphilus harei]
MIEIKNLKFNYKNKFQLNIPDLIINDGIVGLLGTNGSGKTTFFKILSTILPLKNGSININGLNLTAKNYSKIRSILSYMPQNFDFFPKFSVYEVLEYFAILKLMDKSIISQRIEEVLTEVNMLDYKNSLATNLSGGLKRRLGFAISILNQPKILLLDEPTAGVDPKERIEMRNSIKKYSKGRLILISTHIVEDIENLCSDVIILLNGNVKYAGKTNNFIENSPSVYILKIKNDEFEKVKMLGEIINIKYIDDFMEITLVSDKTLDAIEKNKTLESGYLYVQNKNSFIKN